MGIRKTINFNKADFETAIVKNQEASATIPVGTPVVWKCDGTALDGLGVVLPSSSSAVKATSLFAGVLMRQIAPNDIAEAAINGFIQNGLYSRGSRAQTTSAWPSFVAIALGDNLTIDTVANAFAYSTVGAAGVAPPAAVVADNGQTAASTTTAASNAYTQWSTVTVATALMKMIIRNM